MQETEPRGEHSAVRHLKHNFLKHYSTLETESPFWGGIIVCGEGRWEGSKGGLMGRSIQISICQTAFFVIIAFG